MDNFAIRWSQNTAYGIGLLTSDGNLSPDGRHFYFVSVDRELAENLKTAFQLKNKIVRRSRLRGGIEKYFVIQFGNVSLYRALNKIGITSTKSKTIKSVLIPRIYFSDFLRGLFDGDGTFYTFWDKRWPNSFGYQISFASASFPFINWLMEQLAVRYDVKGFVRRGDGVFNLRYVKRDSRKIFAVMYSPRPRLFLKRKYNKIKTAFQKDEVLAQMRKSEPG
ncbi:MAG: LAGLIDADG family homing endonuclease [Candidatus Sungbacteria bacterium]|uniref:LAGLIDADG family homing endonuclease n=1 Tax=Candidatus Sungiibacteriota bacterium TaxID=2750080 RepID=A0A931WMT4_9BACT|nr:LAGLIDADG family homing endonuclease [Candidatus Sungbacteria bacterium]